MKCLGGMPPTSASVLFFLRVRNEFISFCRQFLRRALIAFSRLCEILTSKRIKQNSIITATQNKIPKVKPKVMPKAIQKELPKVMSKVIPESVPKPAPKVLPKVISKVISKVVPSVMPEVITRVIP